MPKKEKTKLDWLGWQTCSMIAARHKLTRRRVRQLITEMGDIVEHGGLVRIVKNKVKMYPVYKKEWAGSYGVNEKSEE